MNEKKSKFSKVKFYIKVPVDQLTASAQEMGKQVD